MARKIWLAQHMWSPIFSQIFLSFEESKKKVIFSLVQDVFFSSQLWKIKTNIKYYFVNFVEKNWSTKLVKTCDELIIRLKDISTPDFSTPSFNQGPFNPRLFNHELFNPWLFNHEFLNHGVEKFMVEMSGVEKSRVELSFNLIERWHSNPRLFNHELLNPMGVRGWKVHGWKVWG